MSLTDLKTVNKVVGAKQTAKAIEKGRASLVYLAVDADQRVVAPIKELCVRQNVPVNMELTMQEIGKTCGIEVGAAAVAVLQ